MGVYLPGLIKQLVITIYYHVQSTFLAHVWIWVWYLPMQRLRKRIPDKRRGWQAL
jgi:hypothetical protein